MSSTAESSLLVAARSGASRALSLVSLLVILVLVERWTSIPCDSITALLSDGLPYWLALAVGLVPKACLGALFGALIAWELGGGTILAWLLAAIVGLYHLVTRWQHTSAFIVTYRHHTDGQLTEVLPTHLFAESLVVAVGVMGGYYVAREWSSRRISTAVSFGTPLLRLALSLTFVTLVEVYLGRLVAALLFTAFSQLPETLVPVWLTVAPAIVYLLTGYAITRRSWLKPVETVILVVYACATHASIWVDTATAWMSLLAIPVAYAGGWCLARKSRRGQHR